MFSQIYTQLLHIICYGNCVCITKSNNMRIISQTCMAWLKFWMWDIKIPRKVNHVIAGHPCFKEGDYARTRRHTKYVNILINLLYQDKQKKKRWKKKRWFLKIVIGWWRKEKIGALEHRYLTIPKQFSIITYAIYQMLQNLIECPTVQRYLSAKIQISKYHL